MRPDDDDGSGGTLSQNKREVYIILKICKFIFDVIITSFVLKFGIDRALEDERFEKADLGQSIERVLRYHTIRNTVKK